MIKPFQMKCCVLLCVKCNVMITSWCSKATKSPVSSLIFILIVIDRVKDFFVQKNIMWSFEVNSST